MHLSSVVVVGELTTLNVPPPPPGSDHLIYWGEEKRISPIIGFHFEFPSLFRGRPRARNVDCFNDNWTYPLLKTNGHHFVFVLACNARINRSLQSGSMRLNPVHERCL